MYMVGWRLPKNLKGSDGLASSGDGRSEGESTAVLACLVVKARCISVSCKENVGSTGKRTTIELSHLIL